MGLRTLCRFTHTCISAKRGDFMSPHFAFRACDIEVACSQTLYMYSGCGTGSVQVQLHSECAGGWRRNRSHPTRRRGCTALRLNSAVDLVAPPMPPTPIYIYIYIYSGLQSDRICRRNYKNPSNMSRKMTLYLFG